MKNEHAAGLITAYNTRESLLLRLKEQGDEASWREFYNIYGRLIFGYALRYRLSHAEAEDVVQDVSVKLFRQVVLFDYSPDQGRFRSWLKTVTRNAVVDFIRRKARRSEHLKEYTQHVEVERTAEDETDDTVWQREWEKAVMDAALQRVYARVGEQCRSAFRLFAVEGLSAIEVGDQLGIKANAVYACKHRIVRMIRDEMEIVKDEM